jgi:hypothetical protein
MLGLASSAVAGGIFDAGVASAAVQTTLYVSPSGSGTACSSSSPCSLSQAKTTVESLAGSMTGDIVVSLAGGTYRLSSTFQLGPQDSGQGGHTVFWEAAPGQTPVINGATQGIWRASVPVGTQSQSLDRADRTRVREGDLLIPRRTTGLTDRLSAGSSFRCRLLPELSANAQVPSRCDLRSA